MFQDGQIRLCIPDLTLVRLVHLISGMDEDTPECIQSGAVASTMTGYTEWVSTDVPTITIGWDWQIQTSNNQLSLKRLGEPRSNVILQDNIGVDLSQQYADRILSEWVDAMEWKNETLQYLNRRYST
ncbi:DUF4902 domain-containing protein [Massilia consociata]|uniref:DUF4902 domain-containing protein n=1 Tax=Massilia consociata TaxID=760117 RepID=A0ABV6FFD8_9BURK